MAPGVHPRRAAWLLGLAALAGLTPAEARAYEDRLTVGVELGVGVVVIPDSALPCCGPLAGITSSIGLDDVFSVRGHLAYAYHPAGDALHVAVFGAELLYLVDIVEIVPYFGLGLDGLGSLFEATAAVELGVHLVGGLEYLFSRDSLLGVDLRLHYVPLSSADRTQPVYFTPTVRYSWFFDL
jgi:hypothetical protein